MLAIASCFKYFEYTGAHLFPDTSDNAKGFIIDMMNYNFCFGAASVNRIHLLFLVSRVISVAKRKLYIVFYAYITRKWFEYKCISYCRCIGDSLFKNHCV
jgi:hypothetical protein